ncbi:Glycolipid transfer protein [Liparis tanakae]|uniref:Glycolipid transfer protein n=1 Tax=Liparis tanakae TaxID=230148 RepID=A0A4Z2F5B0_9TELE|nr:Glycolipid transfer protein [Liparis tanakae]
MNSTLSRRDQNTLFSRVNTGLKLTVTESLPHEPIGLQIEWTSGQSVSVSSSCSALQTQDVTGFLSPFITPSTARLKSKWRVRSPLLVALARAPSRLPLAADPLLPEVVRVQLPLFPPPGLLFPPPGLLFPPPGQRPGREGHVPASRDQHENPPHLRCVVIRTFVTPEVEAYPSREHRGHVLVEPLSSGAEGRACRLPPAACRLPPAACRLPPAACRLPPAACRPSPGARPPSPGARPEMALLMEHQFRQMPADGQVETRPFLEAVSHLPPFFGKWSLHTVTRLKDRGGNVLTASRSFHSSAERCCMASTWSSTE